MDPIEALRQKAQVNLLKKQQVCTDSILKDFNYKISMPLDSSHVVKSNHAILDHNSAAPEEKDTI